MLDYEWFFNFYINRRMYYIFSTHGEVHFYFCSEKANKLVLDHNRTLSVANIFNTPQGDANKPRIKQIAKSGPLLILLTTSNKICSINLLLLLTRPRNNPWLTLYEHPSPQL